jgi:hypothetical protein
MADFLFYWDRIVVNCETFSAVVFCYAVVYACNDVFIWVTENWRQLYIMLFNVMLYLLVLRYIAQQHYDKDHKP